MKKSLQMVGKHRKAQICDENAVAEIVVVTAVVEAAVGQLGLWRRRWKQNQNQNHNIPEKHLFHRDIIKTLTTLVVARVTLQRI